MKLRLIHKDNDKVIYAIVINGNIHYFYNGFTSAEEAKSTIKEAYLKAEKEKTPNVSTSLIECLIDNTLNGIWSKIE